MSSNIKVQRICQFCEKEFTARTTVTRTCSDHCAKRLYKRNQKAKKVEASDLETKQIMTRPLEEIKEKEFLTVRDLAKLLNSSTQTVYRLIKYHRIKAVNLADRKTLIKRSEIDQLFI